MQICAISVLYHPDQAQLQRQQSALASSVQWCLWVDNAPASPVLSVLASQSGATYLPLGENLGIAAAQNRGIEWARKQGASHVLLLDQDSIASAQLVQQLALLLAQVQKIHPHCVIAPRYELQRLRGISRFVGERAVLSQFAVLKGRLVQCNWMIGSGMLIPLSVIDLAGPMREELFIDLVDTEWCYRARAKGAHLFGLASQQPQLLLEHALGDGITRLWCLRWRHLLRYSPTRSYYQTRNAIALLNNPYQPLSHRLSQLLAAAKLAIFNLLLTDQRGLRLKLLVRAVADGLRGRLGAL
jgi:rhamnosyltransferase